MIAPDSDAEIVRSVRGFVEREVRPVAARLDREGAPIPEALMEQLGRLGYLGLTIPAEHGGAGLSHLTMARVTEELARGWLSVGSVMTRSLILGTLLLCHGTPEQQRRWLPDIAGGRSLCAAAFTEPNHGSDTASMECRALPAPGGGYLLRGEKSWCTLADRARLMVVLARTDPDAHPPRDGLSLLVVEKEPGPAFLPPRLCGEPIPAVGYRGMHCFTLSFSDLPVPAPNLIGGVPGRGFKQLMATYEAARIQTAARAVGVAQAALEAALLYARQRTQFGRPIGDHQVVRHKLAQMAARLEAARQLCHHAARLKDSGRRCDLEAGMAKLVAAEMVEFVTREALQIHGGYGYSEEFEVQRFWRDGKLFSLFEGTSEIQAEVIGRRLLDIS